jgi:glycosyltransferase involved in cell wall biosynthesis
VYRGLKVAVAIPAHRAETTIGEVVATLPAYVDFIVVVDDASPDGTWKVLSNAADARLCRVRHEKNQGVGGAMRTAFGRVLESGCDVVVKVDSDGQMDPARIADLLNALVDGGYDYAKGNRFMHEESLASMPKVRLFGNLALTFLTKIASGYWQIFDPQNGFVALRVPVLARLDLGHIARDYFFENDMLIHLNIMKCRVVDVPIPARYGDERSSMKISRILLRFPARLLFRFWKRIYHRYVLREFSPAALFLFLGVPLVTWGASFGAWAWIQSFRTGVVASTGTVMLAVLPFILGFQLILQAVLLDIQSTPK